MAVRHAMRVHGRKWPVEAACFDTHCVACLREFHARERLKAHLSRCSECFVAISQHVDLLDDAAVALASKVRGDPSSARGRTKPAVQALGPRQWWATNIRRRL